MLVHWIMCDADTVISGLDLDAHDISRQVDGKIKFEHGKRVVIIYPLAFRRLLSVTPGCCESGQKWS